jgi:imidazole glycerol phosphate synthase subunit HisF
MLTNPRIIARIDIKGSRLVKGIRFEGQRVYGSPGDYIKKYYE